MAQIRLKREKKPSGPGQHRQHSLRAQGSPARGPLLLYAELSTPKFKSKTNPHCVIRPEKGWTWMSNHFLPPLLPDDGSQSRQCCKHWWGGGVLLPQSRAVSGQHCAHRAQTSRAGPGLGRHRGAGGVGVNKLLGRVKTDTEGAGTRRAGRSSASCTGRKSGARAAGHPPSLPGGPACLLPMPRPRGLHQHPAHLPTQKYDQRSRQRRRPRRTVPHHQRNPKPATSSSQPFLHNKDGK